MNLVTPEKIRILQRKPYCKAKAEPAFRFYVLYDRAYATESVKAAIPREGGLGHGRKLAAILGADVHA